MNCQKIDSIRMSETIKLEFESTIKKNNWNQPLPRFILNYDKINSIKNVDKQFYAKNLEYQNCELQYNEEIPWKCKIANDSNNIKIKYFKPVFVYTNWQFNYFFGFGVDRIAYNKNRIIKLTLK